MNTQSLNEAIKALARSEELSVPVLEAAFDTLLSGEAAPEQIGAFLMGLAVRGETSNELYAEISAKNPDFKRIYDAMKTFRNEEYLWFQVAEYTYDNFMIRARARG